MCARTSLARRSWWACYVVEAVVETLGASASSGREWRTVVAPLARLLSALLLAAAPELLPALQGAPRSPLFPLSHLSAPYVESCSPLFAPTAALDVTALAPALRVAVLSTLYRSVAESADASERKVALVTWLLALKQYTQRELAKL